MHAQAWCASLHLFILTHHLLSTKLKVHSAVVLTSLLYGWETWMLYRRQIKQLDMHVLRSIQRIHWQDCITNFEVLECANSTSIEAMLLKAQLCWAWTITAYLIICFMVSSLLAKEGNVVQDNIKENLRWCNIHPKN